MNLLDLTSNTLKLVLFTTIILILLSFVTNYGMRISENKFLNLVTSFSVSGYAIPGIILAVTLLGFISFVSDAFIHFELFHNICPRTDRNFHSAFV